MQLLSNSNPAPLLSHSLQIFTLPSKGKEGRKGWGCCNTEIVSESEMLQLTRKEKSHASDAWTLMGRGTRRLAMHDGRCSTLSCDCIRENNRQELSQIPTFSPSLRLKNSYLYYAVSHKNGDRAWKPNLMSIRQDYKS